MGPQRSLKTVLCDPCHLLPRCGATLRGSFPATFSLPKSQKRDPLFVGPSLRYRGNKQGCGCFPPRSLKRASLRCLLLGSGSSREWSLPLSYGNRYQLPTARLFCSYCSALNVWRDSNLCFPYSDLILQYCPMITAWSSKSHKGTDQRSFSTAPQPTTSKWHQHTGKGREENVYVCLCTCECVWDVQSGLMLSGVIHGHRVCSSVHVTH